MIKSLKIKNIQSHAATNLEFDPGVNIIIGATDSGKTAIIRSLRRVIWNRPSGDSLCSNWEGPSSIEIATEEGKVLWNRNKTETYQLYQEGKTIEFKAFGTSVPEEISRFLNINEINLQNQLDSHFLLSESAGFVAQHFSEVAKINKINIGITNTSSWIRDINAVIGIEAKKDKSATGLIKQIADAEAELIKYNYLDQFEAEVELLEGMHSKMIALNNQLNAMQLLFYDYCEYAQLIGTYDNIISNEEEIDLLLNLYAQKKKEQEKLDKLITLANEVDYIQERIFSAESIIKYEKEIKTLLSLYEEKKQLEAQLKPLQTLVNQIRDINEDLDIAEANLILKEKEFNDNFPDICPLCNQPVNKKIWSS